MVVAVSAGCSRSAPSNRSSPRRATYSAVMAARSARLRPAYAPGRSLISTAYRTGGLLLPVARPTIASSPGRSVVDEPDGRPDLLDAHQCEVARRAGVVEQPSTPAQHGREDKQPILVDKVPFPQRGDDRDAADDHHVTCSPQPGDLRHEVTGEQGRVVPLLDLGQRPRSDDLGD